MPVTSIHVSIPFSPPMASAAIEGMKCCTSRSKKYGSPGDFFAINGAIFRLIDVQLHSLNYIKTRLYRVEGFNSPEAFEHGWRQLHRGHYIPEKTYFVHFFARADGGDR